MALYLVSSFENKSQSANKNAGGKSVVFSMCRKCSKKPDVATYAEKIKYSLKIAETIPAVSPIAMGAKKLLKLYSV